MVKYISITVNGNKLLDDIDKSFSYMQKTMTETVGLLDEGRAEAKKIPGRRYEENLLNPLLWRYEEKSVKYFAENYSQLIDESLTLYFQLSL